MTVLTPQRTTCVQRRLERVTMRDIYAKLIRRGQQARLVRVAIRTAREGAGVRLPVTQQRGFCRHANRDLDLGMGVGVGVDGPHSLDVLNVLLVRGYWAILARRRHVPGCRRAGVRLS